MKRIRKSKKKWLAAINRCLKQESYGSHATCELCKVAGFDGVCKLCICSDYSDYLVSNDEIKSVWSCCNYDICARILEDVKNPRADIYEVKNVRKHLRRIRLWLKKVKTTAKS